MKSKSIDQKLFEAYQANRGLRLTADEVSQLVGEDDAIGTRISNEAQREAGLTPEGCDCVPKIGLMSWSQFKKMLIATNS